MEKRYIAFDIGDKRIGIAVSDPFGSMALPVETYHRKNFSEDLRHGNMLGIYKVSRKNKYLRNLKQRIRMFRMKLLGDRIEKKRDNLIQ